jgi:hypothetical protein
MLHVLAATLPISTVFIAHAQNCVPIEPAATEARPWR